jgi:hypothetical protein
MNMNASTPLKWGAIAFAVFWTVAMLWWMGATGPVEILIPAFCGALGSYGWYHAMRFAFRRAGLLPEQ